MFSSDSINGFVTGLQAIATNRGLTPQEQATQIQSFTNSFTASFHLGGSPHPTRPGFFSGGRHGPHRFNP